MTNIWCRGNFTGSQAELSIAAPTSLPPEHFMSGPSIGEFKSEANFGNAKI